MAVRQKCTSEAKDNILHLGQLVNHPSEDMAKTQFLFELPILGRPWNKEDKSQLNHYLPKIK